MRTPRVPSIDQLRVLLSVVETGSFTAAAKRLGRATSAVSYAIDALEEQLGVGLFDRRGTRKPALTARGEAIVSEARAVARSVETLLARVNGLLNELEPEISLVVDALFPCDWLIPLLRDLHTKFPTVPVRLMSETLGGVERALRNRAASIAIAGRLHTDNTGFRHLDIAGVPIIPVAASGHPLAAARRPTAVRAEDYVQLVLSERPNGEKRDFGVISINNWRINDIAVKHRLLLDGLGWGGMPEAMVRSDIKSGKLARLHLPDWRGGVYPMQVVHLADTPPGPAGRWLIDRLLSLEAEIDPAGVEAPIGWKRVRRAGRAGA
jgi:DNA-binding transcriptional LysR family regulator